MKPEGSNQVVVGVNVDFVESRNDPESVSLPLSENLIQEISGVGYSEGWCLSEQSNTGNVMIERDDELAVFFDDLEAEAFVKDLAEKNSYIHSLVIHLQGKSGEEVFGGR